MGSLLVTLVVATLVLAAVGLWAACVVFVYIDASYRNLPHPLLWAFGTLWFGPLGLLAYLVDRPKAPQVNCPRCGHLILESDVRCPYCDRTS
ncbi:MAG: zinc ribbon domain-containing protein [Planctomycetota bacterium]|jgi:hypothetical protein